MNDRLIVGGRLSNGRQVDEGSAARRGGHFSKVSFSSQMQSTDQRSPEPTFNSENWTQKITSTIYEFNSNKAQRNID